MDSIPITGQNCDSQKSPVVQAVEDLGREFRCSICLSLMTPPVARLPCCHYFCMGCIKESLKHAKVCPHCKTKITRRDVAADPTMDRVVSKFAAVDDCKNGLLSAMSQLIEQGRGTPEEECRGRTLLRDMVLPWVQGVQDDEFKSPSRSFSGSALEELRKNASRSVSPCSREEILVQPTQDGVMSQEAAQPAVEKNGQKSIRDMLRSLKGQRSEAKKKTEVLQAIVPESPVDEFPIGATAGGGVADILDGLERDLHTEERKKHTPVGASLPSCGMPVSIISSAGENSNDKENKVAAKTDDPPKRKGTATKKSTKTVKRARASRKAIEEAETPVTAGRRIPARLLPWSCMVCTFENKASAVECDMCGQSKDSDAPSPSPQTLAAQEAIEREASKNKGRKRRSSSMSKPAETSHMIESTPQHENSVATVEEDNTTSQQQKLTIAKKKKKSQKNVSRLCAASAADAPSLWDATVCAEMSHVVITASGLQSDDKNTLKDFCEDTGAQYSSAWTPKMTHVVCQTDKDPPKTVKYLMALLHGCQIVTIDWVKDCMEHKAYISEEKYTVVPENKNAVEEYQRLLSAYEIQIQCGTPDMKRGATGLLKSAGAKVVQRMPRDFEKQGVVVVLDHSDDDQASRVAEEAWYWRAREAGVPVVTHTWLRSSILQGKPVAFDTFIL